MQEALNLARAARPRPSLFLQRIAHASTLREAWYRVQRSNGTGGVDRVSVRQFRGGVEQRLDQLQKDLESGAYRPSPLLRVEIAKPGGGVRALGIPTVADRIVQTAAAMALHDRVADLFSDRSFAYRPFLGPRRAAIHMRACLSPDAWVVTADIEKFFDNVEHRLLAVQLRNAGVDEPGIKLILSWLTAPVQSGGRWFQALKGLPQGSPISPVLANWYLTPFDTALEAEGFTHVRYADDFIVVAPDRSGGQRALSYVSNFLTSRLRLNLKPAKTQFAPASDGFTFVGFHFTPETWTVPDESLDRFRQTVGDVLGATERPLAAVAKAHNDLVQGWRNYYLGNSGEMDAQLADLDAWRAEQCQACLARQGQPVKAAAVWFQGLVDGESAPGPHGSYSRVEDPAQPDDENVPVEAHWSGRHDAQPVGHRFSTARQIHEAEIGRRQAPELSANGWLRIPTHGSFVTRSKALLVVRRKKQTIFECALDDVNSITLEAEGVALSTTVVVECARRGVPLVVCRGSGAPVSRILAARSPLHTSLVASLVRARAGRSGTEIALAILRAKLGNQRALLLYHAKYRRRGAGIRERLVAAAAAIGSCVGELGEVGRGPLKQVRTDLFLLEARAAAHYWQGIAALVPGRLGFTTRRHRDARDVVNKALNYGYAHLVNHVWVAVYRAGLEPSLGLLHKGRRRSAGLVFDLMEPFRQPAVDRAVLGLIGRGARLELNDAGDLTLRTRTLVNHALTRRLGTAPPGHLALEIHRRVLAFRRALVEQHPYEAYRMSW